MELRRGVSTEGVRSFFGWMDDPAVLTGSHGVGRRTESRHQKHEPSQCLGVQNVQASYRADFKERDTGLTFKKLSESTEYRTFRI